MDSELFVEKIRQLTDERLIELIQLKTKENQSIIELAEKEAIRRGIDPAAIDTKALDRPHAKKKDEEGADWLNIIGCFLNLY